jgi:general secretion pathway protein B
LLLALVTVAVTLSVVRQRPGPATVAPRPAAPAPQAVPPAPVRPEPGTRLQQPIPARPAPAVIPGTEGVASLDDLTQGTVEDLPPVTAMPAEPAAVEPKPAPAEVAPEAEAEPAPQQQAAPPPAEQAPPAIPPALTQQAPVRKLREMPPDYRADFPALTVEVHVFEPGRRFVMVNGRRYREGERLAEGPQIVEIVRDGIVLEYRGEKVLYPLGR